MPRTFLFDPRPVDTQPYKPIKYCADLIGRQTNLDISAEDVHHCRPLNANARITDKRQQIPLARRWLRRLMIIWTGIFSRSIILTSVETHAPLRH
jgi:hypothetical protein